jgi:hypothetical protein
LFGLETEYAVTALDNNGAVIAPGELSRELLRAAATQLASLPGATEHGFFLSNGSRFYVDVGDHPELAGPECLNPWDAVRYLRAGDRLVRYLAERVCQHRVGIATARIFAGNVDYSGSGSTWGAHESYAHRVNPDVLRRGLLPHLVSRVIYCGAGGFNPLAHGLEFTLSPRAHHLGQIVSDESTHDRGILHTRRQPLCGHGYHRQHLLCGESLRSDLATWLKVGTTALVVAMVESGEQAFEGLRPTRPVEALHAFARDVTLRTSVATAAGERLSAIDIQRRYVDHAKRRLGAPFMPAWAEAVCTMWTEILDRLESGPHAVSRSLDWAIKLGVYRDRVARRGFTWESLPSWSHVVGTLKRACVATGEVLTPLSHAVVRSSRGLLLTAADGLAPLMREQALDWDQLDGFLALRHELLEADTRWAELGPDGIFHQLDAAGVLDHEVDGVDSVESAMTLPPAEGRARIRGMVITRVSGEPNRFACDWDHVLDLQTRCRLDLSDPFVTNERWIKPRAGRQRIDVQDTDERMAADPEGLWGSLNDLLTRIRPRMSRR